LKIFYSGKEERNGKWQSVNYDYKNRGIRQNRKPQFVENGSIYIFKPRVIRKYNNRIGGKLSLYEMEFWQTWQIDTIEEIDLIEYYFNTKIKKEMLNNINGVELIVYDFDGIMTNNKVIQDQSGGESIIVNRSDGLAIANIKKMGIPQIILSTEKNQVVKKRAEKLDLICIQGVKNKLNILDGYLKKNEIDKTKVIYLGNDVNDLEVMKLIGFPVAPSDAVEEIKIVAALITEAKGGDGVIRELYNLLGLNKWKK